MLDRMNGKPLFTVVAYGFKLDINVLRQVNLFLFFQPAIIRQPITHTLRPAMDGLQR